MSDQSDWLVFMMTAVTEPFRNRPGRSCKGFRVYSEDSFLFKEQLCLKNGKCGKNSVELLSIPGIQLLFCEAFQRGCCLLSL